MTTRLSGILAALVVLVLLIPSTGAAATTASPQPTAINAIHWAGQTFLTWTERGELTGERYRVYRAAGPITAGTLGQATLLYEVAEGSALWFANRYADYGSPRAWRNRVSERLPIADGGPPLAPGTGLLVWTVQEEEPAGSPAFYAVTTVVEGAENRAEFGPGNTTGPVMETGGTPRPVRVAGANGWQVYIQFRDLRDWNATFHAPGPHNEYYGLKATDYGVAGAIQYAYDTAVHTPDAAACGGKVPERLPLVLSLHAWGGSHYVPPGPAASWCAYFVAPVDQSETWWFGFAEKHDYRTGTAPGAGTPVPGETIVNYTEQRVLDLLAFLLKEPPGPPVDPGRIYVDGHSMGGGGSLAFALRYDLFAAANASKPVTDHRTAGWTFSTAARWGAPELNLPVRIAGPEGWEPHVWGPHAWGDHLQAFNGTGVWDWQNLQAELGRRPGESRTPLNLDFGINDTAVPWATQGGPMLVALEASRQSSAATVGTDGHNWGAYAGLGANYRRDSQGAPFWGLAARGDESVPAFSRVSSDPPLPPTGAGRFRQELFWSSSWAGWDPAAAGGAPIDTPLTWRVSLCTVAAGAGEPVCGTGEAVTADVTPRRLQAFEVKPGEAYPWEVRSIATGRVLKAGVTKADAEGVLTVPGVPIETLGVRLTLRDPRWAGTGRLYLPLVERR